MKNKKTDFIVIGFALLSMFFGAGNLIFPPLLGRNLGPDYILGIIGFIITGVGIPLLGILASIRINGKFEMFAEEVGSKFSLIYSSIMFILIGPLLAIPRTAATTYELAIAPNFNINPFIIIVIYFAINLVFVLRPSNIIDTLGKFLTPVLLVVLFTLIIKGIASPIATVSTSVVTSPFSTALQEGYQTMDAIGSIIFASLILGTIRSKGYKGKKVKKIVLKSALIAVSGLALIYGGLTYLGAHTGSLAAGLNQTQLLIFLSNNILGNLGSIIIGVIIGLACLTTSIGLLSAGGNFFERISNGKFKYSTNVIIMTVISIGVGSMGLDKIVSISSSLLGLIYPMTIVLILMNLFYNYIPNKKSFKYTVYTTLIVSILTILAGFVPMVSTVLGFLPLYEVGFAWIVPAIIAFVVSSIFCKKEIENKEKELDKKIA